jgi:hypothetical protein
MTNRLYFFGRRWAAIMGAGVLLQAGSCSLDTNALAVNLTTAIIQNVLANLVFGSFNLIPT